MILTEAGNILQIEENELFKGVLKGIGFGRLIHYSGFQKRAAEILSPKALIYRIMATIILDKPMRVLWERVDRINTGLKINGKDPYYRLLKNSTYNWRGLLWRISIVVIKKITVLPIANPVLIIDDTAIHRTGKTHEGLSRLYDHSLKQYYVGHEQLHFGWSDGNNYIPLDFCIKSSSNVAAKMNTEKDMRTHGGIRRKESQMPKPELCLKMLNRCFEQKIEVTAVVFDSWFAKPVFIKNVTEAGYDVVCHLPGGDTIWRVNYNGQGYTLKHLYRQLTAVKEFEKIQIGNIQQKIASIIVTHNNGLKLKLVFCKLDNKSWNVYAATNYELTDRSVLETYAKRWQIEPFFKFSKQNLKLGKEQSPDMDSQIAMTTIRMIIFAVLNLLNRMQNDERTLGILFADIENEFSNPSMDSVILERIFQVVVALLRTNGFCEQQLVTIMQIFQLVADNFLSLRNWFSNQSHLKFCQTI